MAIDDIFAALGDATRRRVLALLRRYGERNLSQLAAACDLTLATMSSHLKILTAAGLVEREKRGREVHFSINTTVAEDFLAAAWTLLADHKGDTS